MHFIVLQSTKQAQFNSTPFYMKLIVKCRFIMVWLSGMVIEYLISFSLNFEIDALWLCRAWVIFSPSPNVVDCEPLLVRSPALSPVNECPGDDHKPFVQPFLPSVSKFCHPHTYFNQARYGRRTLYTAHAQLLSN